MFGSRDPKKKGVVICHAMMSIDAIIESLYTIAPMIQTSDLTLEFSGQPLFEEVNVKFLTGNCYGLIGANGAGKSTFLKILAGDIDPSKGNIFIEKGKRIAVLKQDQFAYDAYSVLDTVMMGHDSLYKVYAERNALYDKDEMTDEEGERVAELEEKFADLDGYNAEADIATMLAELGIPDDLHDKKMEELESGEKIRILLAQALFGEPDILLLDEPTNQLDYMTVLWLEKFLMNFKNTVIVVSHDRHFLNKVCTHIADLDYKKIAVFVGNYDFWEKSTALAAQQQKQQHKKQTEKVKELEEFIRRFSANASKSKQATSRKKLLEKIRPEDIMPSSRRSPFINFKADRPCGDKILTVSNITHEVEGETVLRNISFKLQKGEKIALLGRNSVAKTALLSILAGKLRPNSGEIEWGSSIQTGYFQKDHNEFFSADVRLLDWLGKFSDDGQATPLRDLLGRMLFSGDDVLKSVKVLSGGEKARAMFSKLMMAGPNFIFFDEPTDHLDLESISSLNKALIQFPQMLIVASHDFELLNTVVDRVIEVSGKGFVDYTGSFKEFIEDPKIKARRDALY